MPTTPYEEKKYRPGEAVTQAQQALEQQQARKPGEYSSQYRAGLEDLWNQIQNRSGFDYDINADALYQQVADNYLRQGRQAMEDTLGRAAALTGGYGSSYAQTAGQQQYSQHLQELSQLTPQFRQMALEQYRLEGEDLLNRYALLQQQEDTAYSRYRDLVQQYYDDLDRARSVYESERDHDYSRYTEDRDFDYGRYIDDRDHQYRQDRDKTEDEKWQEQLDYQRRRDEIEDQQWQQEFEEERRRWQEEMAWQQAQAAARAASTGRSSGGGGSTGYRALEQQLQQGGYSSAEMLKIIRQSGLSQEQQDRLVSQYQKPQQKKEVKEAADKRRNDTSAYWGSR